MTNGSSCRRIKIESEGPEKTQKDMSNEDHMKLVKYYFDNGMREKYTEIVNSDIIIDFQIPRAELLYLFRRYSPRLLNIVGQHTLMLSDLFSLDTRIHTCHMSFLYENGMFRWADQREIKKMIYNRVVYNNGKVYINFRDVLFPFEPTVYYQFVPLNRTDDTYVFYVDRHNINTIEEELENTFPNGYKNSVIIKIIDRRYNTIKKAKKIFRDFVAMSVDNNNLIYPHKKTKGMKTVFKGIPKWPGDIQFD